MKGSTLLRHGREGLKNLGRNGWMTFASISSVTIMLFVVGVFLLLLLNINEFMSSVEDDVEIRAYVELTASAEEQEELYEELQDIHHVEGVTYLDRDQGLEDLIESLGDQGESFESLRDENPLNDLFVISAEEPQQTGAVAEEVEGLQNVERVDYGQQVVDQLFTFTNILRIAGLVLVLGLMFTAMFLISNTIKLTIIARRKEIQIMKLVGATNGFIRWPFFVEGILHGMIGAILPIVVLVTGYTYFYDFFNDRFQLAFIELLSVYPLTIIVAVILAGIGVFVGMWGSMMSMRKFLKV
ncbi:permease-like cell division protein FtsX [Thalassobacillus sp. C254]|uniref:permease-like cell division protein FtsX n=1 Tax=Thalassobacillus sp. C254 TaxID=1225341 RepID=UPI0006D03904|nr:permease-like cell division protein FtsX [Thalassobacillus sp. C254]